MERMPPHPHRRDTVVAELVADAHAVRPLWPVGARFALWMLFPALGMALAAGSTRMPDLGAHLREPAFVAQVAALLTAALWWGFLALRASVPGREPRPAELALAGLLAGTALTLAWGQAPETVAAHDGSAAGFVWSGLPCSGYSLMFATLPWIAALIALRRGAPLAPRMSAALAGGAAFLAAAAALRMACPLTDGRWHLLAWHLLPVAAGVAVSAAAGAPWIRRWRT